MDDAGSGTYSSSSAFKIGPIEGGGGAVELADVESCDGLMLARICCRFDGMEMFASVGLSSVVALDEYDCKQDDHAD